MVLLIKVESSACKIISAGKVGNSRIRMNADNQ